MALETKVILNLLIALLQQSRDVDVAIQLLKDIANTEGVNVIGDKVQ